MNETPEELQQRIAAYIDGELPPAEAARLEVYLANTDPGLADQIVGMLADKVRVRALSKPRAPIDLSARIMEQIERATLLDNVEHLAAPKQRWWQSRAAIAASVLIVLGGFSYLIVTSVIRPRGNNPWQVASDTARPTEKARKAADVVELKTSESQLPAAGIAAAGRSGEPDREKELAAADGTLRDRVAQSADSTAAAKGAGETATAPMLSKAADAPQIASAASGLAATTAADANAQLADKQIASAEPLQIPNDNIVPSARAAAGAPPASSTPAVTPQNGGGFGGGGGGGGGVAGGAGPALENTQPAPGTAAPAAPVAPAAAATAPGIASAGGGRGGGGGGRGGRGGGGGGGAGGPGGAVGGPLAGGAAGGGAGGGGIGGGGGGGGAAGAGGGPGGAGGARAGRGVGGRRGGAGGAAAPAATPAPVAQAEVRAPTADETTKALASLTTLPVQSPLIITLQARNDQEYVKLSTALVNYANANARQSGAQSSESRAGQPEQAGAAGQVAETDRRLNAAPANAEDLRGNVAQRPTDNSQIAGNTVQNGINQSNGAATQSLSANKDAVIVYDQSGGNIVLGANRANGANAGQNRAQEAQNGLSQSSNLSNNMQYQQLSQAGANPAYRVTLRTEQLDELAKDFRVSLLARGDDVYVFRAIGDKSPATADAKSREDLLRRTGVLTPSQNNAPAKFGIDASAAGQGANAPAAAVPAQGTRDEAGAAASRPASVECIITIEPVPAPVEKASQSP